VFIAAELDLQSCTFHFDMGTVTWDLHYTQLQSCRFPNDIHSYIIIQLLNSFFGFEVLIVVTILRTVRITGFSGFVQRSVF
jgi:hypothetical protein